MMRGGVCWERTTPERRTDGSGSGLWHTPRASDTGKGENPETFVKRNGDRTDACTGSLAAQVMWPTPKASAAGPDFAKTTRSATGLLLQTAVQMFPTPQANEDASGTPNGKMQRMLGNCEEVRGKTEAEWAGGSLSPVWTEWLMGWPLGYTALTPLSPKAWAAWQRAFLPESRG
jgi:hypothetical protein